MNAEEALVAYGFQLRKGVYRRRGNTWERTDEGWLRKDDDVAIPYAILPEFKAFSGISHTEHLTAWDWHWPEEEIVKIYEEGVKQAKLRAEQNAIRKGATMSGSSGVSGGVVAEAPAEGVADPVAEAIASIEASRAERNAEPEIVMEEPPPEPDAKRSWWKR